MPLAECYRLGWDSGVEGAVLTCNISSDGQGEYCACHRDHHASGSHAGRLLERLRGSRLIINVLNGEPLWKSVYTCVTYKGKSEHKVGESNKASARGRIDAEKEETNARTKSV